MSISKETVQYVAHLARLELCDEELTTYAGQLERILEYIDQLKGVDVSGVAPTAHVLALHNVGRKDTPAASLAIDDVLQNAPHKQERFFKVPPVIE